MSNCYSIGWAMFAVAALYVVSIWPLMIFLKRRHSSIYKKLGSPNMWSGPTPRWHNWKYLWKFEFIDEAGSMLRLWMGVSAVASFLAIVGVPIVLVMVFFSRQCQGL